MKIETKILKDIKKYGWHIIHVLEDHSGKGYSYTIGFNETLNHPEVVISGLGIETSSQILNGIGESIREGKYYQTEEKHDDILEGYDCVFSLVNSEKFIDYFGRAMDYYKIKTFKIIQCFYPNKDGLYPWEIKSNENTQQVI